MRATRLLPLISAAVLMLGPACSAPGDLPGETPGGGSPNTGEPGGGGEGRTTPDGTDPGDPKGDDEDGVTPDSSHTSLRGNPAFDDSDRRLKDGRPFTAQMNTAYDGIKQYWIGGAGRSATVKRLEGGNSYHLGRSAGNEVTSLLLAFRITGDLELLDELARLGNAARSSLRDKWAPGSPITRKEHGEKFWAWTNGDPDSYSDWGGDDHLSDTPKSWSIFARVAWALEVNRDLESPGGLDYGALADEWRTLFEGYERVWSSVDDDGFPAGSNVASTYKGAYRPKAGGGGSYVRAKKDEWPTNMRSLAHTNWSCAALAYYMGKILGKSDAVTNAGIEQWVKLFMEREQGTVTSGNPYGDALLYGRNASSWMTDPSADYEMPTVYGEYVVVDALDLFLEGNPGGHIKPDFFARYARSIAGWVLVGSPTSFSAKAGIAGLAERPFTTPAGVTRKIGTAADSPSSGSGDRTMSQYATYAYHLLIAWDTPDGKLEEWGGNAWKKYSGTSGGSLATPKSLLYPVGLLLKGALNE